MKKKILAITLCTSMVATFLSGCGSNQTTSSDSAASDTTQTTEAGENTSTDAADTTISIWHDGDESIISVIEQEVNTSLEGTGVAVHFEKKTGLTDQIKLYGNDEANGPDLYMYAHDTLGTFVQMGMLAPISEVTEEDFTSELLPMTVEAGSYDGKQYMMPLYFETLLFMYNKDLWQGDIPKTTDDLLVYMKENTDTAAGTYAVVNQHSTAYNVAPFINGFGGYIIDENSNPGLDNELTKEAIAYNQTFVPYEADGDYNTVTALFNEGKAQAIIGGPWLVSSVREAGINLGIASLSDMTLPNGKALAPYSGVQGIGVLKMAAEQKKDAIAKVLKALADPSLGVALAKKASCAPANTKSYDDADVAADEMIMAIRKTADTACPMPNVPEMSVMWGPAESLLAAVNKSGEDLDTAAKTYQEQALSAIQDMK